MICDFSTWSECAPRPRQIFCDSLCLNSDRSLFLSIRKPKMSDASMMNQMHACLDSTIRMLVCREATDACYSAHHACMSPLPLAWKDIDATAVSQRWIHFRCPLGSEVCGTIHMVPVPPTKPGSGKVEVVSDLKTILCCLSGALQRGSWDELSSFVVKDTFTGLRINITSDTVVDYEDETAPVDVEYQVKKHAALSTKGRLTAKSTALVRQAIEHKRAKVSQRAHISIAVACQMARYRLSMR